MLSINPIIIDFWTIFYDISFELIVIVVGGGVESRHFLRSGWIVMVRLRIQHSDYYEYLL